MDNREKSFSTTDLDDITLIQIASEIEDWTMTTQMTNELEAEYKRH